MTGLPAKDFREAVREREIELETHEDDETAITVVRPGYSPAMRHLERTLRVSLMWLHGVFKIEREKEAKFLKCGINDMRASFFYKADRASELATRHDVSKHREYQPTVDNSKSEPSFNVNCLFLQVAQSGHFVNLVDCFQRRFGSKRSKLVVIKH